ncbi:hypothetical protein [Marinobacter mangrovi]|uniref:hypothetical protein n=1 Tax=Marinobacter mangrovi TaxID=2803918 RepID=UPI001933851D|nr:hypothetical protein [Marinobacter mangrovi]
MPTPLYQRWLPILFGLALLFPASELHAEKTQLTLAQVYEKGDALKGYWVSEKLDGVRAYWDGEHLISRQGHAFHPPTWFTRDFGGVPASVLVDNQNAAVVRHDRDGKIVFNAGFLELANH